ncbi:MAG: class I SAM-dependent methyltransferase [Caulobacteraceae bacterium]|nr:class I SAM-dependent methyltransferase [Caulobacteraceae bacterium]
MAIHPKAKAFDTAAPDYVRGRPDYPAELLTWLTGPMGISADARVVDLAAGTGKFTRLLVKTGARVIAVEPVAGMRRALRDALPQVETLKGTATAIPLGDGVAAAVLCAQAFHWFANADALTEIARVVEAGGRFGLVWNVRDDRVPWVKRISEILDSREADTPRHATGEWRRLFPSRHFGPLHETEFTHGHTGAPGDVIVARVKSVSFIAALPLKELAKVEAEVRAVIDSEAELRGKGEVTFPYVTRAYWTQRL